VVLGLVLGKVDYGESDQVVTLFTDRLGRVSALARGARRSQRRFGGALEAMHTLKLELAERRASELMVLREASLEVARMRLVSNLALLEAAGRALSWIRKGAPGRTSDRNTFASLTTLLDRLNDPQAMAQPAQILGEFSLHLLSTLGFGLDFRCCVRCGRRAREGQAAMIDPERGGLLCRSCGGARVKLDGARRARLARAGDGEVGVLFETDTSDAIELGERALHAHLGIEPR
jgi:DNA repair protein RecO (recombination protein O)